MKRAIDLTEIVYGELLCYLQKIESAPLLRMTLAEATELGDLLRFIKDFIPNVFYQFVSCFIFGNPLPVPSAPISSWKSIPVDGQRGPMFAASANPKIGWEYISIHILNKRELTTPKLFLGGEMSEYKYFSKIEKKQCASLCCIVLAPDWEKAKEIFVKSPRKPSKPSSMPARKFIAELRNLAKVEGIEVLSFKGFLCKYEKTILGPDFKQKWSDYQHKLYLDFMKRFPMLAYSLCHEEYLAYNDYKNRAELDLLDGKYPETVAMHCKALEYVLRIYYFMKNMEDAPDKELGWLFQSLRKHIKREMGDMYCNDLEFVLARRPYAVHAKKERKELTELDAQEVGDRINVFCKTFFYKKWRVRV